MSVSAEGTSAATVLVADRLSDMLLVRETRLFAQFESAFVDAGPGVRETFDRLMAGPPSPVKVDQFAAAAGHATGEVIAKTVPVFEAFMVSAMALCSGSVQQQLVLLESRMGPTWSFVAWDVAQNVPDLTSGRVKAAVADYRALVEEESTWVTSTLSADLKAGLASGEGPDGLLRRVFDPAPFRGPGHSGKGVWWKPYQRVTARARSAEFAEVNGLTSEYLMWFTAFGQAR